MSEGDEEDCEEKEKKRRRREEGEWRCGWMKTECILHVIQRGVEKNEEGEEEEWRKQTFLFVGVYTQQSTPFDPTVHHQKKLNLRKWWRDVCGGCDGGECG